MEKKDKKENIEQKTYFRTNQARKIPIETQTNSSFTQIMRSRKDKKIMVNNNLKSEKKIIPLNTKEEPKDSEQIENGEKKIQKESKEKPIQRGYKRFQTISEKKGYIFNSQQFYKMCNNFNIDGENVNNTERIDSNKNLTKENENGVKAKRPLTPKKKSKDIKLVPFDSIEKDLILEPKIMDSEEIQISFSDTEELQSIYESFFIASIPKGDYSFEEDINNSGEAYCSKNLGQCGHSCCLKLPAYKGGLIFQYPKKEKNEQNFQISELVISLCFPYGIKVCFGNCKEEKPELFLPKKPSDFYFVTTNQYNDRNYVYVYNFYLRLPIEKFKEEYKCDPIKTYLNLLIKNNDKNFQMNFEECQNMINNACVYIPHTACLVSKYPYFKEMKKCIYSILKIGNNEDDLSKLLKNLIYEIPDINKYRSYDLQLNYFIPYCSYPIILKSKYYNRGLDIDIKQLPILFEYFQIPLLLKIFKLMLASQKLLFVVKDSSEYQNLSLITLSLLNLLYPFNWKYTYVTLLSINMLKFLQSFLPFIMGIDSNMMEYAKNNYIEKQNNITIIYLRKNRKSFIETENPDENANIEIPSELREMLANDLQTIKKIILTELNKEENILMKLSKMGNSSPLIKEDKSNNEIKLGKKIREVFLKFFVEIFGDYQEYTSSIDETAYFNTESFLNNVPQEYHNFYLSIFNSEMFHDFLQRNVVINSPLYKPDKYYNKYCIREKKGYILKRNNLKKFPTKKKKTFLNDDFNINNKQSSFVKQSPNHQVYRAYFHKNTINPSYAMSSKIIPQFNLNMNQNLGSYNSTNNKESLNNCQSDKKKLFNHNDSSDSLDDGFDLVEEKEPKSLDSSFNEDSLKILVSNRVSNKYIIPPFFLKFEEKEKQNLNIKKISKMILDLYGLENLIKIDEFEFKYIFDKVPMIIYDNLSLAKKESLNLIDRYIIPIELNNASNNYLKNRSNTIYKSLMKDNKLDPKIIQLEDYMKEILSSSGKNAYKILYPNGMNNSNPNSINNGEEKKEEIKDEEEKEKDKEKENGGSRDKSIGKINNMNIGNKDMLSITDFQKKEIRRHFAFILFQKKDNAYQSNIISSDSFNILSKLIFNVFLYCANKSIDDFQVCRALTKSLYLYYKKNTKGKKVYLYHFFNKTKPFDIWKDKAFWNYYFEREMENQNEKNDNTKFDVLIEISSIMNDLHFSANTQLDIIIDFIAKKEIKDNNLREVLLKTIIKQFNNRMVVSASMEN